MMSSLFSWNDNKIYRHFGILVGGIFFLISLIPLIKYQSPYVIPGSIGVCLVVMGLSIPGALKPLYMLWMKIGLVLNWVNTRLILGIIFYGMFTPTGLIRRMMNKDSLERVHKKEKASYWHSKEPTDFQESMKYLF